MGKHLSAMNQSGSWTYSVCESCLKNAHDKIAMVREKTSQEEMWVCPVCGATKRL